MVRNFRKPLIMAAPKVLLRHPSAVSTLNDMSSGTCFSPVLDDMSVAKTNVTKVIFCSGQHYYNLDAERQKRNVADIALVRLEVDEHLRPALCHFPARLVNFDWQSTSLVFWSFLGFL